MSRLTPGNRVLFLRRFMPALLVLFGVFSFLSFTLRAPATAYATTASTVNFQARLQTNSGAIVPDGDYNVEFKLYSAASGGSALWTEDYLVGSSTGLVTKDGYLSTALGSQNAFPSTIDWSQQLYLTMNIGGTAGTVVATSSSTTGWDGEMTPRLALTASTYAFMAGSAAQAGELSNLTGSNTSTLTFQGSGSGHGDQDFVIQDQGAAGTYDLLTTQAANNSFVQLEGSPVQQTGGIDVSGTVIAAGGITTSSVDTASSGTLTLGGTNADQITIGETGGVYETISGTGLLLQTAGSSDSTTAFQVQNSAGGTALNVDTQNNAISVGTSSEFAALTVQGSSSDTSANAIIATDSNGNNLLKVRNDGQVTIGRAAGADSTIGKTDIGANSDTGYESVVTATKITTGPQTGVLSSVSVYIAGTDLTTPGTTNKYVVGIYGDTSGHPGSLIASSSSLTITPGAWNTASVSASLAADTTYYLAFSTSTTNDTVDYVPNDTSASTVHYYETAWGSAGVTLPSTFSTGGSSTALDSIYANVSESGALASTLTVDPTNGVSVTTPTNTATAFQVQNASGISILTADTTDNQIQLGTDTGLVLSGSSAYISNPQEQSEGEAFGDGATLSNGDSVAFGFDAAAAWAGVAVGHSATNNGASNGVAIGESASSNWDSVVIGSGATGQQHAVSIGTGATAADYSISIGENTDTNGYQGSILLGESASASAANQLVIGGDYTDGGYITDAYIGSGVTDSTPQNITIHATGSSADGVAGANFTLVGGDATTGDANGGNLLLQGGSASGAGISGVVEVSTQSNSGNDSGAIVIMTGNSAGTSGNISIDNGQSAFNSGSNVLDDTFESGSCASTVSDFVSWYGLDVGDGNLLNESGAQKHGGSCSAIATETSGSSGHWGITDANAAFTVVAGKQYTFSVWVRSTLAQEVDGVVHLGGTGTLINLSSVTATTTGWTQMTGTAVAPAGSTVAYMELTGDHGNTSSSIYFDDITVDANVGGPSVDLGSANAQTVNIGNANQQGVTTLQGGSGGVNVVAANGGLVTIQGSDGISLASATTTSSTLTVGASAGTGGIINNGTTQLTTDSSQSFSSNGSIANINTYSSLLITATNPSLTLTLPDPSPTTAGKLLYISNNSSGSNAFTLAPTSGSSTTLNTGDTITALWNGVAWTYSGQGSGSGSAGANTSLTNLSSVAINAPLNFQANQTASEGFTSAASGTGNELDITGQTAGGTSNTGGAVKVQGGTGSSTAGSGGLLTLQGGNALGAGINGGVTIDTGSGATTANGTVSIGTTNAATVNVGNGSTSTTVSIQGGTGGISLITGNNGSGAAGNVSVDTGTSSSGSASISVGATNAQTVNIGGANVTGGQTVNIDAGASTATKTINIGSNGSTVGATTINIGHTTSGSTGTQSVVIGSSYVSTNSVLIQSGTTGGTYGAIALQTGSGGSGGTISIGANAVTNTVQIGTASTNTGNTQQINIGDQNAAGTTNVLIGSEAGATAGYTTIQSHDVLALGNGVSSTISIQGASGGTVGLGNNGVANTIQIGQSGTTAVTQTVNIGNGGTGTTTNVTVGNANSGTTTIQGNGISQVVTGGSTPSDIIKTTTNSATAFQIQNSGSAAVLGVDTSNGIVSTKDLDVGSASNVSGSTGGRIFSDGFESGNFSQYATVSGAAAINTSTVRNGKYSAKFSPSGTAAYIRTPITVGSTFALRGYVYVTSQTSGLARLMELCDSTCSTGHEYGAVLDSNGDLALFTGNGTSGSVVDGPTLTLNTWHEIEVDITIGSPSSGASALYLDGTNIYNFPTGNTGSVNPTYLNIGEAASGRTSVFNVDDVVVDTVRPGDSSSLNVNDSLHVGGSSSFGSNVLVQTAGNSAYAFQVQNAAGNQLLDVDTAGSNVNIGSTVSSSVNSTINIANSSAGVQTVNLGSTNSTSQTLIQGGAGSSALQLQVGSGGTIGVGNNGVANTINVGQTGTGAVTQTINIGNGGSGSTSNVTVGNVNAGTTTIQGAGGITISNNTTVASGKTLTVTSNEIVGTLSGTTLTVGSNNVPNAKLNVNTGSSVALRSYQAGSFDVGQFATTGTGVGTVTTNNTTSLVGSSTQFTQYFQVGDAIQVGSQLRTVATITDDTHLTVSSAFTTSTGGQTYSRGVLGAGTLTTNGTAAIVGSGTSFLTTFQVGDSIMINGESVVGSIASITDNTHLTLFANAGTSASSLAYARYGYDRLDIKANGNVGIGTNNPNAALQIQPNGVGQAGLLIQASNGQTANLMTVQDSSSNVLLNVAGSSDTVNVGYNGSSSVNSTVNIGNASGGVQTVTLGSTNSTSSTTIQGGNGGNAIQLTTGTNGSIAMTANGTGFIGSYTNSTTSGTLVKTLTNSTVGFQVQNSSSVNLINVDTTGGSVNLGLGGTLPLLGYNVIGANGGSGYQNTLNANQWQAVYSGTISSMTVYVDTVDGAGHNNYQVGIYADSGGAPGALLAQSGIGTLNSANSWNTIPISLTLTANLKYWFAYWSNPSDPAHNNWASDGPSAPNAAYDFKTSSWTGTNMPSTFGTTSGPITYQHSVYVSYAAPGYGLSLSSGGALSASGSATFEDLTNSTTAFQIQNNSGYNVMTTDTTNGQVVIGTASHVSGTLQLASTGGGSATILTPSITSGNAYTITLPTTGASASGQCLQSGSGSTTTATSLTFGSCSGSTPTLQQAYVASAGANPSIDLTSTNGSFSLQNDATTSITTGNLFSVSDSKLTTGNAVNIVSTSAVQTAGSLFNVSDTATLTTAGISGNLANISRSLTANVSSAGTPTLDTATTFSASGYNTTFTNTYTVGSGHSNYYMLVGVFDDQYVGAPTVTYGGVAMTNLGHTGLGTATTGFTIFGLKAPAIGSNKLVVSGNPQGEYMVVVQDYYNVNQTTPFGTFSSSHSNSGNPILGATSANGRVVAEMMAATGTNAATNSVLTTGTHNASQVQAAFGANTGIGNGPGGVGASYSPATTTTTNMYWTTGTGWWAQAAVDLEGTTKGTQSVSNAAASVSDNCTNTNGACDNGSSVLNLNEQYAGATGAVLSIANSGTGDMVNLSNGSGTVARISNYGAATFQNSTNTTSAFQIQNSSAANVFNVDTTNGGAVTITNNGSASSPAITRAGSGSVESDNSGTGLSSLSFSPTTVGDLAVLAVDLESDNTVSSLSGGGVTNWQYVGTNGTAGRHIYLYMGRIATSGAGTISLKYSSPAQSNSYVELTADEFTSAYGANTSWSALTAAGSFNSSTTTITYPSLSTAQANQLYWGYGYMSGANASAAGTAGYSYDTTTDGSSIAWTSSTKAITAYQPVANIASGGPNATYAVGAIFSATPTAGSALNVNGSSLISASSNAALQVNNASGNSILTVDTNNGYVIIGKGATGESTPSLLVLDNGTSASDPVEVDGGMYYNATTDQFRCGMNGAWTNCINGTVLSLVTGQTATAAIYNVTSGTVAFAPMYIPGPMTVNTFRVHVTTAYSGNGDIGLYDSNGNLVLDTGTSSLGTTTGVKTLSPQQTGAARNLPAGQYYMAITGTGNTAVFDGIVFPASSNGVYKYAGQIGSIGGTTLPSSITPSSISTGIQMLWGGLSN